MICSQREKKILNELHLQITKPTQDPNGSGGRVLVQWPLQSSAPCTCWKTLALQTSKTV